MVKKILIFVPGYNISKTIGKAIDNLILLNKDLDFDAIYVDNCSSDASVDIVKRKIIDNKVNYIRILQNKKNLGYGGSQKVAFKYAFKKRYNYLMEYDGDLQYPFETIPIIYDKIKSTNASIVFGSRVTKAEHCREMGFVKRFGNHVLNYLNNWAFNFGVSEIHTGFRIYNLNLIDGVDFRYCHNDYRWSLDSVVEILKINANFSEIPIPGYYHKDKSSPSFTDLIKYNKHMVTRALRYKLLRK